MKEIKGKYNTAKVFTDEIEETAASQIQELMDQEFVQGSKVRIMPDCHAGAGCTIGTTMTITDKVVANLVGVDIGCGVFVGKINTTKINMEKLDDVIRDYVPAGTNVHREAKKVPILDGLRCSVAVDIDRAKKSVGTLGGVI
ncbi:MAG: RtcB family protein [Clostridiaceae bacterium]